MRRTAEWPQSCLLDWFGNSGEKIVRLKGKGAISARNSGKLQAQAVTKNGIVGREKNFLPNSE